MPNKLTTDIFIERSKNIHGDTYDYSLVEYVDSATEVKIICSIHGVFSQIPSTHYGKYKCGCSKCSASKRGLYNQRNHTTETFIERSNIIHSNRYSYKNAEYKNSEEKIIVTCSKHGDFKQVTKSHLEGHGCPKCGTDNCTTATKFNTKSFIEKAVLKYQDKYDYSLVDYVASRVKIDIICREHGKFKQEPVSHLRGHGCPICAHMKKSGGWTRTDFRNFCSGENRIALLYLIHFENPLTEESFYKIGITSQTIKERTRKIEYFVKSVITYTNINPDIIYNLETILHRELKHEEYRPLIKFGGHTECFNYNDNVLETFKNKITNDTL